MQEFGELLAAQRADYLELVKLQCREWALARAAARRCGEDCGAAPVAGAGERAEADALATAQLAEVDGLVGVAAGGGAGVAASSDTIYNVKAVDNGKAIEDVLAFDMLVKDTTYEETNSATERRSEGEAALTNKLVKATTYEEITEEPQRSEQDMDAEIGTEIQRRSEGATMEFQSLSAADLGSTDSEPFPILPSSIVGLTCKLVKETTYKEISEGTQKYEGGMNRVIDTEIQRRFEGDAKEFQGHSGKALETTYYDINSETAALRGQHDGDPELLD
jgi:hypothetical protein